MGRYWGMEDLGSKYPIICSFLLWIMEFVLHVLDKYLIIEYLDPERKFGIALIVVL